MKESPTQPLQPDRHPAAQAGAPLNAGLLARAVAVVAAWLFLYHAALPHLWERMNSDDFSYALLAPVIAGYMAWSARDAAFARRSDSWWLGLALLLIGAVLSLGGALGALDVATHVSMWATLGGLAALFLGPSGFVPLLPAWITLAFAVPPPPFIERLLTFNLRLVSSELAVRILHLIGVPAFREGNVIDLGDIQLQVVDACSGLRYFFPALLMAIFIGWLWKLGRARIGLLTVLSLPVILFANSARILLTGATIRLGYPELAEGVYHDASGLLVYLVIIILLVALAMLLKARGPAPKADMAGGAGAVGKASVSGRWGRAGLACALLVATAFAQGRLASDHLILPRTSLAEFPTAIGPWEGRRIVLDEATSNSLGADDYLFLELRRPGTDAFIYFLVPFYERQASKRTAHAPTSCLVGGGWAPESKVVLPANQVRPFPVQQMLMTKDRQRLVSNFWFEQRGRIITSEYANKWYLTIDALTSGRSDGALVRAELYLPPGMSEEEGQRMLDAFLAQARPMLSGFIPG